MAGQVLFTQGDADYDVMVVLAGSVSVLIGAGEEERELVSRRPGDLMVELNLFTGQGTGATGIVREAGSVLAIPGSEFPRAGRPRPVVRRLRLVDLVSAAPSSPNDRCCRRRGSAFDIGAVPSGGLVETSRPGVFAVGDARSGSTKIVAPAAGDGGMAVRFAGEHLAPT